MSLISRLKALALSGGPEFCVVCQGPCEFRDHERRVPAPASSAHPSFRRYEDRVCPYCGGTGRLAGGDIRCVCLEGER